MEDKVPSLNRRSRSALRAPRSVRSLDRMKLRHLVLWVVVPLVSGLLLLYGGITLTVIWEAFSVEHNFFGFAATSVLAFNDYFVWSFVALVVGFTVGCVLRHWPGIAALATVSVGLITFVAMTQSHGQTFWQLLSEYAPQIASSFFFAPMGALFAARILRPDKSLEHARGE